VEETLELKHYSTIQFAKPQDIPQIVAMGYKVFEEIQMEQNIPAPSKNELLNVVTDAVIQDFVLVKRNKKNNKKIEGVVVLKEIPFWWNTSESSLKELFMYIEPEFRSLKLLYSFIDSLQQLSKDFNRTIYLEIVGKNAEKFDKVLKRKGFDKIQHTRVIQN